MTRWRPVLEFPGYSVSDQGQVCGLYGRVLRPTRSSWPTRPDTDYLKVGLYRGGKRTWRFVQRLVLLAFVGPPPEGLTDAGHENHDSLDNRLSNLAWVSRSDNLRAAHGPDADERRAIRAYHLGDVGEDVPVPGVPF